MAKTTLNNLKNTKSDIAIHFSARIQELEKENLRLRTRVGGQKIFADAIKSALIASDPFPRFKITRPVKTGTKLTACLELSDWHIGEVISKTETEGFGGFNYEIAQERAFHIVETFIRWIGVQRGAYNIDECVIFGIGDYISGDIHRELSVTNEFPVPVQTAKAGLLFGECIRRIAPRFNLVTVYEVGADNHGRLTLKGQFKQKSLNSMSYLVHVVANAYLEKHQNVKIVFVEGMKHIANIRGKKFLIEHGDIVRSWMGIPYYGLEREQGREARRRMNTDKGFDYQVIGHWHVPGLISGNIIVNGSLSGTSEYDHAVGRHAAPAQVAFLVHPEHGIFNILPIQPR